MATISVPFTGGILSGQQTTHSIKFPAGVTEATIHLWGTGGSAGGCPSTTTGSGGGGAGGQYARSVITVDDETTYTLRVGNNAVRSTGDGGAGIDSDWETDVIVAKGGAGGLSADNGSTGASGSSVGGVGDVVYAGGNGSNGDGTTASGAGGGGAGTTGAGGNASGTTAGTGTSEGGGNGGGGRTAAGAGLTGSDYGGGGGGGLNTATSNRVGGRSSRGGAIIEFEFEGNIEISSWAELAAIQESGPLFMALDYILTESIDKDSTGYSTYASATANTNTGWISIGAVDTEFTGTFDGQFNTIGDLVIDRAGSHYGLFGRTSTTGVIKNLGVIDCDITATFDNIGALIGSNFGTLVEKCWSTGQVSGRNNVGGLIGSSSSLVKQCWSSVDVYGSGSSIFSPVAGGFCSDLRDTVENCYCKGSVEAGSDTYQRGGLGGATVAVTVTNCYTISPTTPTGGSRGGGMAGFKSGTVTDTRNFYDTTATGWNTSEIGTGKTTAEMKNKDTYTDWDFDDVWDIRPDRNDGYPYLRWEYPDDEPVLTGAAFLLLMV